MANKVEQIKIRATKEDTFNVLKAAVPSIFGTKVWANVESFRTDENDQSKFTIIFNEVPV